MVVVGGYIVLLRYVRRVRLFRARGGCGMALRTMFDAVDRNADEICNRAEAQHTARPHLIHPFPQSGAAVALRRRRKKKTKRERTMHR